MSHMYSYLPIKTEHASKKTVNFLFNCMIHKKDPLNEIDNLELLSELNDMGVDINHNDIVLINAINRNDLNMVRYIYRKDHQFDSFYSIEKVDFKTLEYLINNGLNVNDKKNLLGKVCSYKKWDVATLLINNGTPIDFIFVNDDIYFVDYIIRKEDCPVKFKKLLVKKDHHNIANRLLNKGNEYIKNVINHGFDVNYTYNNFSILDKMCSISNIDMVEFLIEKDANVTTQTLDAARIIHDTEILHMLLKHMAKKDLKTALKYICEHKLGNSLLYTIVELL